MTRQTQRSLREIFTTWFGFGIQSFGGGASTFFLIHRACMRQGWMEENEFIRTWALAQISPGINLIKLTVMIGYKLRGWPGVITAMAGLLMPSGAVTVLMTAGFSAVREQPWVMAAMRGVLPATIGLSLANCVRMARPLMKQARREGRVRLAVHFAIAAGAAVLMASARLSPAVILLVAGVPAWVFLTMVPVAPARPEANDS